MISDIRFVQVVSICSDPVEWLKAIKLQLRSLINLFTLVKGSEALQVQPEANWESARAVFSVTKSAINENADCTTYLIA